MTSTTLNPYAGNNFFSFFKTLFLRISLLFNGQEGELFSDELQILVLLLVSFSSALVGSFLILRKMTMLANSLSHTILFGIVLAFLYDHFGREAIDYEHKIHIGKMLFVAVLTGVLTTFLTEFCSYVLRLQEDASTGLVFSSLFAFGIILISALSKNSHIGVEVVTGNVDAVHREDLRLLLWVAFLNSVLFFLFFKEFKLTSFDPVFARTVGISQVFFNYLLMVQVSITSIGAFRVVGVLMVLAFLVGPALIGRLMSDKLEKVLLWALASGGLCSVCGVAVSRHFLSVYALPMSTAGITVCLIAILFSFALANRLRVQGQGPFSENASCK